MPSFIRLQLRRLISHSLLAAVLAASILAAPARPAAAQAGTYYVATTGSDTTGDGSASKPWATINHAIKKVTGGSTILVKPGTYNGQVKLDTVFTTAVTIKSESAYKARLRHTSTVVIAFKGKNITLEGFDIAHTGSGAGTYVIQIQDLITAGDSVSGGTDYVSNITLKNNVIHDSYNNDLLKINNGAGFITVEKNMFYNQTGQDEHIDVNSATDITIKDNIFFNDFGGSGRTNNNDTASFIVVKDSNGSSDTNLGSLRITIKRNVFLNWQGSSENGFITLGEDGKEYHEAQNVTIENNLFLGNSGNSLRAPLVVKGGKTITFRNNTVVGDLPSKAFAMRLDTQGSNPNNQDIFFYNNIWSDPTGTMGSTGTDGNDYSDSPKTETDSFTLSNNLYWNGTQAIPSDTNELVNYTNDAKRIVKDPLLPALTGLVIPRWNESTGKFADGSTSVRQAFEKLVNTYAIPASGSPAYDVSDKANTPGENIFGHLRDATPNLGAY